ncbi:hypothetical protein K432DRAFT_288521 [Lepidopterella palustris CBS 459.81]|uniref:Uncharacterized protein n=1 Tax=Lepidopterella palustris CBS 459.81 TaxID=1314670 RepID=A0A8E2EIT3_9PEZI|nr:hypothetical protein K432DRAFT_288521 [Lepidopterella palustris CBS 459.81]
MDGSTAQAIATGSQDFAALAGLFCTDGVERNLLAAQYGYASVAVSSLSILGLLGLVKSTVKIALGLEKCITAGFTVDSLRGRFGFLPDEMAPIDLVECDVVDVQLCDEVLFIRKKKQYLQKERNSIIGVGGDWPGSLHGITAVNLGNARHERSFTQNPIVIALTALLCSGATAWLLLIVSHKWNWLTCIAIPGLHGSLLLMLAMPLVYEHQTNRPATHISAGRFKALYTGIDRKVDRLRFLHSRVNGGDVLHFRGSTGLVDPGFMQLPALAVSAFCAVAYICQYAVLKTASSSKAFIWIGSHAALALIRVALWTWNPSFDDPKTEQTEYALVSNNASATLTFGEFICASSGRNINLNMRVWEFLASYSIYEILRYALELEWNQPLEQEHKTIPLLFMDLGRILRNRSSPIERKELDTILDGLPLRLGFRKSKQNYVRSFLMTETSYKLVPSEFSHAFTTRWCWVEITRENNNFGFKPCRGYAVKEDGEPVHLRGPIDCHKRCSPGEKVIPGLVSCGSGCSWKNASQNHLDDIDLQRLEDKTKRISQLADFLHKRSVTPPKSSQPDVYLTATPGTTTRKGIYCDPAHRYSGTLSDKGFGFDEGIVRVAHYIEQGISSNSIQSRSIWKTCCSWWESVASWFPCGVGEVPHHYRKKGSSAASQHGQSSSISGLTVDSLPLSVRSASPFHFV